MTKETYNMQNTFIPKEQNLRTSELNSVQNSAHGIGVGYTGKKVKYFTVPSVIFHESNSAKLFLISIFKICTKFKKLIRSRISINACNE